MATVLLLAAFATAQVLKRHDDAQSPDQNQSKLNAKKPKNYPRAIAVIEFLPGGGARLVPVALWINDRFYDASLYGANPAPMAVQPDTVYEATNYGEPLGLFTVTTPEELKGSWIASGQWKPHFAFDDKLAAQAAKQAKAKPADDFDSNRPVLRRPGSSGSSGSSSGGSSSGGSPGSGNSSAGASTTTNSSSGNPPAAENDPNRPTLKKPDESTQTSSAPPSSSSPPPAQVARTGQSSASGAASPDENDPDRPVLRRGKPEPSTASSAPKAMAPASMAGPELAPSAPAAQAKPDTSTTAVGRKSFPAVSDAGKHESRSLLYAMNPQERASKSDQMSALAMAEIQKVITSRHSPVLPKNAAITDYDLRAYDLEFSNSPTLVFTASLKIPGAKPFHGSEFDYFVTVVAREDFNGNPIKIFSSVTDSNHLDAYPRLEIIDAVDADANGRGDLLFRQYSDTGISYSLYRVFPYDMQKVFEGGSGA